MNHHDHVALIKDGVTGSIWADLGAGAGAFTLALADCLGGQGVIYAVDQDRRALNEQQRVMYSDYPAIEAHYVVGDFTRDLNLPPLDGVVMANSLHFVRSKGDVLRRVRSYLKHGGHLVIVEYNTDKGNLWVPHPFSFRTWQALARQNGFVETKLLGSRPSHFLGEIYSALSR